MVSLVGASFGMQCFWGAEALFGALPGVVTTRVGYAGGSSPNPTYRNLADHIETVDLQFDDKITTYQNLLDIFFNSHDPTIKYKRQYISAIFYHNEDQRKLIEIWLKQHSTQSSKPIVTEVIQYTAFHNAENYHQKYFLRKYKQILSELDMTESQIIISPIATRLNGFCAGFGNLEQLAKENFKISEKNITLLQQLIRQGPNLTECGI